jgi:hypothetical protein
MRLYCGISGGNYRYRFSYDKLLSVIMPYKGRENLIALCDAYYNKYNAMAGYKQVGHHLLVSTQFLIPLAMAFGELVAHTSVDPETVDRESLQTYDRLREHVFFDIERMARELGTIHDTMLSVRFLTM